MRGAFLHLLYTITTLLSVRLPFVYFFLFSHYLHLFNLFFCISFSFYFNLFFPVIFVFPYLSFTCYFLSYFLGQSLCSSFHFFSRLICFIFAFRFYYSRLLLYDLSFEFLFLFCFYFPLYYLMLLLCDYSLHFLFLLCVLPFLFTFSSLWLYFPTLISVFLLH